MDRVYKKIKEWLKEYKNSMLQVDNQNLSSSSKVSLVVFVIIIFIIIGSGVDTQQSMIVKPYKKFSYKCTDFVEQNSDIDKFQKRDISQDIYGEYYAHKYWELEYFKYNHHRTSERNILSSFGSDVLCQNLAKKYLDLANSDALEDKLITQEGLKKKIFLLNAEISSKTDEYSNALLENIANQKEEFSILSTNSKSIKKELKKSRAELRTLEKALGKIEDITTLKEFHSFKEYLDKNDEKIIQANIQALKYYRLEYTLSIFSFLFPVWLVFYILYRNFKRKGHFVSAYLSVNVANVSALYIVFNTFLLVYTIIPKIFFGKLIAFLAQYNLTLFLNITAIIFFMLLFGFFIHRIQKNRHTDSKDFDTTIRKNIRIKELNSCPSCGNKHNINEKYCGFCSTKLLVECKECKGETLKAYPFCTHCAKKV